MAHLLAHIRRRWQELGGRAVRGSGDEPRDLLAEIDEGRAIPGDIVDALLDNDAPGPRRLEYLAVLRHLPEANDEFDGAESVIDAMRDTGGHAAPDFTGRILSEVHRRRGLLDGRAMRRVSLARWSAAACVVLTAAGLFLIRRAAPEATNLVPTAAPLRDLARSLPADAGGVLHRARSAFELVRFEPATLPGRNQACAAQPCAGSADTSGRACRASRRGVATPAVTDDRLIVASWLEAVEELAAFARIDTAPPPARLRGRSTMPVAWSPNSPRNLGEAPVISVRVLLTEPSRPAPATETPPLDRLLPEPRR